MRKAIVCNISEYAESIVSNVSESTKSSILASDAIKNGNRRLMRDIMYYLRKLIKLAQRAQRMSMYEGVELSGEDKLLNEEFEALKKDIDNLESGCL